MSLLPSVLVLGLAAFAALLMVHGRGSPPDHARARIKASHVLGLCVVAQAVHFVEEAATGLPGHLAAMFGLPPIPDTVFVAFNVLWLGIWTAAIPGVRSGRSWAFFAAWFLAIAGVVNGLAHPLAAAAQGRYFPGLGTSVLVAAVGGWLWLRLRDATRPRNPGDDPVGSRTPYILMLAAAAASPTGCQIMDSNAMDENIVRIEALDDQWRDAAARRDLDGMMAIYAPDARELLPDLPPVVGRDAIRAFYGDLLDQFPRFAHEFETDEIIVAESGDLAVARGRYRFTPDTLNAAESQSGKFVGVWRYRDGDWRLQINISSSDGGQ